MMKRLAIFLILLWAAQLHAATTYIAATAGVFSGGTACNGHTAITPASWTSASPGDIVWLCGGFTGAANSTIITVPSSGTSGNPITINFDTGAYVQAPYCNQSNGCINMGSKSYIVLDGKGTGSLSLGTFTPNGIVQNTANGDALANQHISVLVYANACANCTIQNLDLANAYVAVHNTPSPIGGPATQMQAVYLTGSNWVITNNLIHDCGWCMYEPYTNGDTNIQVYGNEEYNWDHAWMFASPNNTNTASGFYFHDNKIHDNVNWEDTISGGSSSDCPYHLDGIHFFGVPGSTMDNIYVYNNWWYGTLSGPCSSGFLFSETGSSAAGVIHMYVWNNFFDATGSTRVIVAGCSSPCGNANGWVGLFSGSTTLEIINNTMLYANVNDGTNCYAASSSSVGNFIFEDNVLNGCTLGAFFRPAATSNTIDYNFWGDVCNGSSNCMVWNGSFTGSFSAFKTALSGSGVTGADAHSQNSTYAGALLNSDGSPQASSPVILHGANFGAIATGALATLANDTTKGGSRTTNPRPASGTCTTLGSLPCWDVGAYEYSAGGGSVTATVTCVSCVFSTNQFTTSATQAITITNTGSLSVVVSSAAASGSFGLNNLGSCFLTYGSNTSFTIPGGASCTWFVYFAPGTTGPFSGSFTETDNSTTSPHVISLSGTGTAPTAVFSSASGTSYAFGATQLGAQAQTPGSVSPYYVTLTNGGNGPLAVNFSFGGTNPTYFGTFATDCSSTVAAGAHCTIGLRFNPANPVGVGSYSATFIETDSVQGLTPSYALTGTGIQTIIAPAPTMILGSLQIYSCTGSAHAACCRAPLKSNYFLCVASDGLWMSNNGAAYHQL